MNKSLKDYAQLIGTCLARRWMRDVSPGSEQRNVDTGLRSFLSKNQIVAQESAENLSRRATAKNTIPETVKVITATNQCTDQQG